MSNFNCCSFLCRHTDDVLKQWGHGDANLSRYFAGEGATKGSIGSFSCSTESEVVVLEVVSLFIFDGEGDREEMDCLGMMDGRSAMFL